MTSYNLNLAFLGLDPSARETVRARVEALAVELEAARTIAANWKISCEQDWLAVPNREARPRLRAAANQAITQGPPVRE